MERRSPTRRSAAATAALLLAVAAGCDGAADREPTGRTPDSGVSGVTLVDVGCPPSPDATDCPTRPLAARLRVVPRDADRPEVDVRTGSDGRFRVPLTPGTYELVPENLTGGPYPRGDRVEVEVRPGEYTAVSVPFDSGVR